MPLSRRAFISTAPGACAAAGLLAPTTAARAMNVEPANAATQLFPRQDLDLVRQTVGASHRDFDRVKELVTARPALARASHDWGFGDWETALGAASHTGRRNIAELLLEHGARPDIFVFAMLGDLNAVKAAIEQRPGVQRIPGPHGLSLLHHAEAGGELAEPVAKYLLALGDADAAQQSLPMTEQERAVYTGTYHADSGPRFDIVERDGLLVFDDSRAFIQLFRTAEHEFHPSGVPEVRFRFELENSRAQRVTIVDGPSVVTATRA